MNVDGYLEDEFEFFTTEYSAAARDLKAFLDRARTLEVGSHPLETSGYALENLLLMRTDIIDYIESSGDPEMILELHEFLSNTDPTFLEVADEIYDVLGVDVHAHIAPMQTDDKDIIKFIWGLIFFVYLVGCAVYFAVTKG